MFLEHRQEPDRTVKTNLRAGLFPRELGVAYGVAERGKAHTYSR